MKTFFYFKKNMEENQKKHDVAEVHQVVRVALFGLGRIGTIHLKNLRRNPRVDIVYSVDESKERLNFIRNEFRMTETKFLHTSEQDIVFKDKSINCVLICTPTFIHEELILKSLNSGKAAFCEKPLALTHEGIERCLETAKKLSIPLLCAFNRRFDPGLRSLKNRTDAGEVGKVHVIKTCSRDCPKPPTEYLKTSGGIFHDCAIHDIDYVCWLLGEKPESVMTFAHANYEDIKQIGDHDTAVISMKFPSGALASIDISRHAIYGYDQRVEILGPKGMLTSGDQRPTGVKYHDSKGATAVPISTPFEPRYRESYAIEMEHFLNVVQGTEKCEVELESSLRNSIIASACGESARTGKPVLLTWNN